MDFELNGSEKILLETIRKNDNSTKSVLVEKSNLPWSTVSTCISSMIKRGIIIGSDKGESNRETVKLNNTCMYFYGISVGTSNIKIVLTDMLCIPLPNERYNKIYAYIENEFMRLNEDFCFCEYRKRDNNDLSWCFVTPNNFIDMCKLLSKISLILVEASVQSEITVKAICFVFPGIVDFRMQRIINSNYSNQSIKASSIEEILDDDALKQIQRNNIELYIDHNVKASTLYEYSQLQKNDGVSTKDFSVFYLGYGLGNGMVINDKLIRGVRNSSGQIGHIFFPKYDDDYINNFFEINNFSNENIFDKKTEICRFEDILRNDIFSPLLTENYNKKNYKAIDVQELGKVLCESKVLYRRKLAFYLALSIFDLTKLISIDTIVFSGKLSTLFPCIKAELKCALMNFHCEVSVLPANNGEFSAAFGAAEIAYKKSLDIDLE